MRLISSFIFCLIATISFGQIANSGVVNRNGKYYIDTTEVLENQNLEVLINEISNTKLEISKTKSNIPPHIFKFLKRATKSRFSIANPGEAWQVGCVVKKKLPLRQLIFVGANSNYCLLSYFTGGRFKSHHIVIFKMEKKNIVGFWSGYGNYSDSYEATIAYIKKNLGNKGALNTNVISL